MRIAVLVTTFPSLSETFVLREIVGLLERGHEVDIYPLEAGRGTVAQPQIAQYGLLSRSHPPIDPDAPAVARARAAMESIVHRGWRDPLAILRSLNVVRYGRRALALRTLGDAMPTLGRPPYQAVYCHFGPNGLRAVELQALGALHGPIVTTFHGYDLTSFVLKESPEVYRPLFERGALFLPISENWRRRLIELGAPADRCVVHRMGVDLSQLPPRNPAPPRDRLRVLSVARLVEKKGLEYGIRAVGALRDAGVDVEYRIIGDGPLGGELRALVAALNLDTQVQLTGPAPAGVVAEALGWCDVLLSPSVTAADGDQEGIPVVLMEAMARVVPVVASAHSGIPELVVDGATGLLAPERDVAALASQLRLVRDEPARALSLARAGRERVVALHDASRLAGELEGLLALAAGKGSLARSLPAGATVT
jgi:colanic acid/amylovoran biosynthesis glycosyltransferase